MGSVGNPRRHDVASAALRHKRGLSKRLWAARSAVQGGVGQVVGSALVDAACFTLLLPGAVHERCRGTGRSPVLELKRDAERLFATASLAYAKVRGAGRCVVRWQ